MASAGYQELSSGFTTQTAHDCVPLSHPDRQIRVLDLKPVISSNPITAPALHGQLRVINLPTNEAYSAVSYVWAQTDAGTSERENQLVIHCNDHQHNVQLAPNCWSALWHIVKIRESLPLWIDAVCIDQRNDEGHDVNVEKLQQIPLMRSIYASAYTTYFWLGESAGGTDKAMDYLSKSKLSTGTTNIGDSFRAAFELFKYSAALSLPPRQAGLEEIYNRPWIRRLWVLQECLLSRTGIVMCGLKWIAWQDLVCVLESMDRVRTHRRGLCFNLSYQPWFNLAKMSQWFAHADRSLSVQDQQLHQAPEAFDILESRIQDHVKCLKSAFRIFEIITVVVLAGSWAFWMKMGLLAIDHTDNYYYILTAVMVFLATIYMGVAFVVYPMKNFATIVPATQPSICEELRNRKVTCPKDIYYGTVGILGHGSINAEEDLYTLYRRLCTGLIEKTQKLDILTFANIYLGDDYPGDDFPSWVIRWDSVTSGIWGKVLQCRVRYLEEGIRIHDESGRSLMRGLSIYLKGMVLSTTTWGNGTNERQNTVRESIVEP